MKQVIPYSILLCFALIVSKIAQAQKTVTDSVIVSATRTVKTIGNIPVPISVISKNQILQTGAQRLIDVLQQQPGIVLADNPLGQSLNGYPNPFGSGVQLQGLDAAYTQILVDGEPLTGRNAGILNLGRIAVGNIKQIEILKGPATSLYGSESIAGVINIVTDNPTSNNTSLLVNAASNNTFSATLGDSRVGKKWSLSSMLQGYSTNGYDLDKSVYGKTTDAYKNIALALKFRYQINGRTNLLSALRFFNQRQPNDYLANSGGGTEVVIGETKEMDWSLNNQLTFQRNKKSQITARLYATSYDNSANVSLKRDGTFFDASFLKNTFVKPELQMEWGEKQKLVAGVGYIYQTVASSRYAKDYAFNAGYAFIQKEWLIKNKLDITLGARADKHTVFDFQFSPKLALGYKLSRFKFSASVGRGFKAPDFRQQFLNFANGSIGYSLIGANELGNSLAQLQQQGLIAASANINPYLSKPSLKAETSMGAHFGVRYSKSNQQVELNVFRNDINNLIETFVLPFQKINNQAIYSYLNLKNIFTQGIELSYQTSVLRKWNIVASYQYLDARDKQTVQDIKEGKIVRRDPLTFVSSVTTTKEYGGLFNRSKHTANLQLTFKATPSFYASLRTTYRGRYGFADVNGNAILDDEKEYTKAFTIVNFSIAKTFSKKFQWQLGCDNLLNHTNPIQQPNFFGRNFFTNVTFQF